MKETPSKEACPFCQRLIERNLISDHIMCHQVENEDEFNNKAAKNPYGNSINNSSQSKGINSNNISNNNKINNNPNNDQKAELKTNINLLKALIEINKPSNNGQIDYDNILKIISGKSNENNNNNSNASLVKDGIRTIFDGISLLSNECKDIYNQFNTIKGRLNSNYNNNMGSSNVTNSNPVSNNKTSFDDNNNLNVHQNNNQINENEINLIMECLSTDILKEIKVGENNKCLMCNEEFNIGQSVTTLPCSHVFHFNCIKSTLKYNNKCPNCQFEISLDNIIK